MHRRVEAVARTATRITEMLARRGHSQETAEAAARAVLPPEGWD